MTVLLAIVWQSVVVSRITPFGCKLSTIPILLVCICLREGPEKGGLFVLLAALFWSLSGVDLGSLSLLAVTVLAVLSAVLCQTVLTNRFPTAAICCFVTTLLNDALIFAYKLVLGEVPVSALWRVLLPGAALSMLSFPLAYLLVKAIFRIGGQHGV